MSHRFVVAVVAILIPAVVVANDAGRLCWARDAAVINLSGDTCTEHSITKEIRNESAQEVSNFIWVSSKSDTVILGHAASGTTSISPVPNDSRRLRLRITAAPEWPATVKAEVETASGAVWRWSMSEKLAATLRSITVPRDARVLRLSASRYRPQSISIPEAHDAVLDAIVLQRTPSVFGQVVDAGSGAPIPAATVTLPGGESIAITDAAGFFEGDVELEWPQFVRITASGRGVKWITVPSRVGQVDLGRISLRLAGALYASVKTNSPAEAEILAIPKPGELRLVAKRTLNVEDATLRIPDLAPGNYQLLLRADGPLQRFATPFVIEEGVVTEKSITIEPGEFTLEVRREGARFPNARVKLRHAETRWSSDVTVDESGRKVLEVWQRGKYWASVTADEKSLPFSTLGSIEGATPEWVIDVKGVTLEGKVVDEDGSPIVRALVGVIAPSWRKAAPTDESGEFEIDFVEPGQLTLEVRAEGYLHYSEPLEVRQGQRPEPLAVVLVRPVTKKLLVRDHRGLPLARAAIVHTAMVVPTFTDANGEATLALNRGEVATVFVIPREGSFAITRVAADEKTEIVETTVPPGEALIGIRAQSNDGKTVSNVGVVLRYNGYFLPLQAVDALRTQQSVDLTTGAYGVTTLANMPVGVYEFWPAMHHDEKLALLSGTPKLAPVQLAAQPGPNWITMTFARKNP